ncbi:MAG: M28 family peptidase, partial [Gammaproteobacteria bacterium]|nr:M28 family peptidase [Phycisphaerae bacterium]NIR92288.1 M28 family peptidase [Gammaproteobacteria bacterium]NIW46213.1 M28 family peptidase [Gammaproteobacteria bacterium]NIW96809.1 M28 family peptidase [Phycisphaerae bacterium]NIX29715.1 M28 family peptidase [Phycisphaerae bacterium]
VTIPAGELPDLDRKIVVAAHYDTVWLSPGADDNASGVSVLLELAQLLKNITPGKAIELVAFTNEEQPFAETELMGSRVYLEQFTETSEKILAMF